MLLSASEASRMEDNFLEPNLPPFQMYHQGELASLFFVFQALDASAVFHSSSIVFNVTLSW